MAQTTRPTTADIGGPLAGPVMATGRRGRTGLIAPLVLGGDATPPMITVVSPTPGVLPGQPGGFPADWNAAKVTPIVLNVTDLSPGLVYVALVATLPGGVEEVVYRRGGFRGRYAGSSTVVTLATGFRFTVLPAGGWPSGPVTFSIDPIDGAGNLGS